MSEALNQLAEEIKTVGINKFGLPDQVACDISVEVVDKIRANFGGTYLYIPKNDKKRRNLMIKKRFNGINHSAVCSEFCISKSTLYRVIDGND